MKLQLSAIDTWFFRDSTPFHMEDSSQAGVVGMFPPYPPTVAGAIRAALARRNGWDGRAPWSGGELAAILGDGPTNLGRLRITGPFVLRDGVPVFPMPRHVVGRDRDGGSWAPRALLRPGLADVPSDLGPSVRLPVAPAESGPTDTVSLEPGSGLWVTLTGLQRILRGELPGALDIIHERELWTGEGRVGIARMPGSRTVAQGALYSTRHVRPATNVSLGVEIEGVPPSWSSVDHMIPLGGESRIGACEAWNMAGISLEALARDAHVAVIIALTPVLLDDAVQAGSGLAIPGARVVSACIDRPLRIGGWDSQARAPQRLKNAAASGSVWFCELDDPDAFQMTVVNGLVRAGAATAMGFGLCAAGSAPQWERTK